MRRGVVLVLCGLPASGKTRLTDLLERVLEQTDDKHVDSNLGVAGAHLFRVTYDFLLPTALEKKLIEQKHMEAGQSAWREYREQVLHCVDCLLQRLCPHHPREDASVSHVSDNPSTPTLDEKAKEMAPSLLPQFWKLINFEGRQWKDDSHLSRWVILIDDNMYYHSMRYQYFQLARKYSVGFCQVHVTCSTATALQQNASRGEGRVPDDVIVAMAAKMEKPDPQANPWERFSLSWDWSLHQDVSAVLSLLEQAWENPVPPVEDREEEREEARRICSASFLHQVDQILRRLIASEMSGAKGTKSKSELKAYAKTLSSIKAEVLEDFRQGRLVLDWMEVEVESASHDADCPLFKHVAAIFHHKLGKPA